MSRKIIIDKYQGNTHYNIHVIDSFGQEHHLGYYNNLSPEILSEVEADAEMLWNNEVELEEDLMANAIHDCKRVDEKAGRRAIL